MIFLLDYSYSMKGTKITQVNQALPSVINKLHEEAKENKIQISLHIIAFSNDATWIIGDMAKGVILGAGIDDDALLGVWKKDLEADGITDTDKAIRLANEALSKTYLGDHALRPVVILMTDGICTCSMEDYTAVIDEMKRKLSGNTGKEKVTRIAIGVGDDYDKEQLELFASQGIIGEERDLPLIFDVKNVDQLAKTINWVAISSMHSSITTNNDNESITLPDPDDVWA